MTFKYFCTPFTIICLFHKIKFVWKTCLKFFWQPSIFEIREYFHRAIGSKLDETKVTRNLFFDPLVLNLHSHHFSSRSQGCPMNLPKRSTSQRFLFKINEYLIKTFNIQFHFHDFFDIFKLSFWRLHQHRLKTDDILRWDELIELAHHLPQFYVWPTVSSEAVVQP